MNHKLTLTRDAAQPVLTVDDVTLRLDEALLQTLADLGGTAADWCGPKRVIAPYLIGVALPYSDLSPDQSTPAYSLWLRADTASLARRSLAALNVELAATRTFRWVRATLPAAPSLRVRADDVTPVTTVTAARRALRGALVGHQSDGVACEHERAYWTRVGLTTAEWRAFQAQLRGDSPFDAVDSDGAGLDAALAALGAAAAVSTLGPKLRRWAAGTALPIRGGDVPEQ